MNFVLVFLMRQLALSSKQYKKIAMVINDLKVHVPIQSLEF